jgi:multiple sugar transport system permease protein
MVKPRRSILPILFVGPTLLLLIALNVFPLLYMIVMSFTNARIGSDTWEWVGTTNYQRVFGMSRYADSLQTTALFVVCAVSLELLLGFVLALALQARIPVRGAVLMLLLVPMMLSPAVMGLFWHQLLNGSYGLLNLLLARAGIGPVSWLTGEPWRMVSIVMVDVWMWTPFMMLISLAGLNAIPKHLYEAAEIDRAGRWTVFRRITLPLCAPLLGLAVLLRLTDALKQFDLVMAITGSNTPSTQTLSALLYQDMVRSQALGRGSAFAVVVLTAVVGLAILFTRYLGRIGAARRTG